MEVDDRINVDFCRKTMNFTSIITKLHTFFFFQLMFQQKFKIDSYCMGGSIYPSTVSFEGYITNRGKNFYLVNVLNVKETSEKMLVIIQQRLKSLGKFCRNLGKFAVKAGTSLATNVMKFTGGALEIGAKTGGGMVTGNPKAALSAMPEVLKVYLSVERKNVGKFA